MICRALKHMTYWALCLADSSLKVLLFQLWVDSIASIDSEENDWTPQQIKRQEVNRMLYYCVLSSSIYNFFFLVFLFCYCWKIMFLKKSNNYGIIYNKLHRLLENGNDVFWIPLLNWILLLVNSLQTQSDQLSIEKMFLYFSAGHIWVILWWNWHGGWPESVARGNFSLPVCGERAIWKCKFAIWDAWY